MSKKYKCFWCNKKFVDLEKHTSNMHPKLTARSYDFSRTVGKVEPATTSRPLVSIIINCEHENRELRHHSNKHNYPICMRYWKCKDCGEVLEVEDFSFGCNKHSSFHGKVKA